MKNLYRLPTVCLACAVLFFCTSLVNAQQTAPHINYIFPAGAQQGKTLEITVGGLNLIGADGVYIDGEGLTAEILDVKKPEVDKKKAMTQTGDEVIELARLKITVAADARVGPRDIRIVTPKGISNRFRFHIGSLPEVNEVEPNTKIDEAQQIESLPVVVNGQVMSGECDFVRFAAKAGWTLVCRVEARSLIPYIADAVPGWFQPVLTLYDANGKALEYVDDFRFDPDPVIIYKVQQDAELLLEIRDSIYRGREDFIYRLSIGTLPFITHIYPLGGQPDTETKIQLYGVNLGADSLNLKIPADSPSIRRVEIIREGLKSNALPFAVDKMQQIAETESNDSTETANKIEAPVIINGRIEKPGDVDYFSFQAKAKQQLVVDVRARRLNSPLDSVISILNSKKRQLVENDDTVDKSYGLVTHHADSYLLYRFPADGEYTLCIRDVQSKGGDEYAYRIVVAPPRPDFDLRLMPDNPTAAKGASTAITVHALRKDGFKGAIKLTAKNLPDGYTVSNALIAAGLDQGRFTLTVPADAPTGIVSPAFVGTAALDAETVTRPVLPCEELMQAFIYKHLVPTGGLLMKVTEPASFTLTHDAPTDKALEIKQGATVKVNIKADRTEAANAAIAVAADTPPRGITVKRANIAKDANEAVVTITATKQARIGFEDNIILTGTMKVGKETTAVVLSAVSIKVIDPKQQKPPQLKKVVQAKPKPQPQTKSQPKPKAQDDKQPKAEPKPKDDKPPAGKPPSQPKKQPQSKPPPKADPQPKKPPSNESDPKKDNPQKKAPPEKTADKK